MQIKNTNDGCLLNYISETKASDRVKARFWLTLISIIVTVVSIIATVHCIEVSKEDYNHRYDADAQAAGGFVFTLSANAEKADTFTASAGRVTYGYFQKDGETPSQYELRYKPSDNTKYLPLRTIAAYRNGDCVGYFELAYSQYSQKYDLSCKRLGGGSGNTTIEIDWGVMG